jgi:hypothetical protein
VCYLTSQKPLPLDYLVLLIHLLRCIKNLPFTRLFGHIPTYFTLYIFGCVLCSSSYTRMHKTHGSVCPIWFSKIFYTLKRFSLLWSRSRYYLDFLKCNLSRKPIFLSNSSWSYLPLIFFLCHYLLTIFAYLITLKPFLVH